MGITTANKFWLSLSKQDILKGNVGITVMEGVVIASQIKSTLAPFDAASSMVHPVLPKFQDLYLMVAIKRDNLGLHDENGRILYYDNLRKSVESEYCNFVYDSDKYIMHLITSAHSIITDATSVTVLSTLFTNKKLHRILDIYVTDIKPSTESEPATYNITIRYLEDKK